MKFKAESLIERLQKLELEVKLLKKKQEYLEDSIPTIEDIKALEEAERALKENKLIPLSKIKKELGLK